MGLPLSPGIKAVIETVKSYDFTTRKGVFGGGLSSSGSNDIRTILHYLLRQFREGIKRKQPRKKLPPISEAQKPSERMLYQP